MSGINSVTILGRLGAAPEIKDLPSGDKVCTFSVATSEKWNDKKTGEEKENTSWHRISTFGKLAEVCSKYLDKGKQIYLSGKLKYRTYEKDGITMYATDIIADRVEFLGSATSDAPKDEVMVTSAAPKAKSAKPFNHAPGADNEPLPF